MQPDAAPLGEESEHPSLGHRGGDTCPPVWPQVRAVTSDKEKVMGQAGRKGEGQGEMGSVKGE